VVFRSGLDGPEFLLVTASRTPSEWVLPKGHIEPGEDPSAAAAREVREEAGVDVEILRPLDTTIFQVQKTMVRTLFFLARAREQGAPAPEERRRIVWLPEDEARAALSYAEARAMLTAAAQALRG
jgi:ADP-ribose pyrophosphatase YjhB (NUDIX family)